MTPFEKASMNTQGMCTGMVVSLIKAAKIKQVMAEEASLAQLGGGAPAYFDAVNINLAWHDVALDTVGDC
jgi:hypothetical protein